MNYGEIRETLDNAVMAIIDLPQMHKENEVNKPASRTPFIRTTLLPSRPNRLTVGAAGKDELIGLYQIDVYYPIGTGASQATTDGDTIVAAFPRTWTATVAGDRLRVTQSWVEAAREVNGWYAISVMLSWSSVR